MPPARVLTQPAALILLAANAVPVLGVLFWNWDAFLLLVLYWMETGVIGFWTFWLIGKAPERTMGPYREGHSTGFLIGFLTLHAGMFMGVHFVFLWALFAGDWKAQIHSPAQFIWVIVILHGLWFPLLVMVVARGIEPMLIIHGPDWYRRKRLPEENAVPNPWKSGGLLYTLYARILVMQFALIASGMLIEGVGGASAKLPLIMLIVIKTAIDLGLFLHTGFDVERKAPAP